MTSRRDLKILIIEKENIELYFDFKKLVKNGLDNYRYLYDYSKKEVLDLLDNGGVIALFRLQNIIVSGFVLSPYEYNNLTGYLLGPILVFQDVVDTEIYKSMIEWANSLIVELGCNNSFVACYSKDLFFKDIIVNLNYNYIDNIKHKSINYSIYYKDIT